MQGCSLFMRCQSVTPGVCWEGQSLFIQCQNLPPRNCGAGVQPVYAVSEPNFCELWVSGAACLCSVVTYHLGSVGHGCILFLQCQNIHLRDYEAEVQPAEAASEPTSQDWGAGV